MRIIKRTELTKSQYAKLRQSTLRVTALPLLKKLEMLGVAELSADTGKEYVTSTGCRAKYRHMNSCSHFYVEYVGAFGPRHLPNGKVLVERLKTTYYAGLSALSVKDNWADKNVSIINGKLYLLCSDGKEEILARCLGRYYAANANNEIEVRALIAVHEGAMLLKAAHVPMPFVFKGIILGGTYVASGDVEGETISLYSIAGTDDGRNISKTKRDVLIANKLETHFIL